MKRSIALFLGLLAMLFPITASYADEAELAQSYLKMFETVEGMQVAKALHCIKPEILVKRLKKGEAIATLDIRTPAETSLFGMTTPDHRAIPLNQLFKMDHLAQLPKDRPLIVICKSGTRAAAATTALRHLGFENAYLLKGGIDALAKYLNPKTANQP